MEEQNLFGEARRHLETLRDLMRFTVSRFETAGLFYGHGTTNGYDEAAWLLAGALHIPLERLDDFLGARLLPAELAHALALVERRCRERIPVAYLLNEAWLGDRKFYVDERVIVPRSFIAELLDEQLAPWVEDPEAVTRGLDLCTGSGCLAILMAQAFPNARIDAVDLSPAALDVARRNIADYGLEGQVVPVQSDLYAGTSGRYDLIISNPPYVNAPSMATLPDEYRREPEMALASGADGLDHTRRILAGAIERLNPGGLLVVEIGHNREAVETAWPDLPLTWLDTAGGDDHVFLVTREGLALEDHLN